MKIKIGSITYEINQLNNEIFNNPVERRLYIDLKDTNHSADEIFESFEQNYTGYLTIVNNNDEVDIVFSEYILENIRKMYDVLGEHLTIELVKREPITEEQIENEESVQQ